ncbi:MAG: hypothetical protein M3004_03480 [Bacteroidota bacterium]|nr:hypothetical protein [Bacteroidota bacterium]
MTLENTLTNNTTAEQAWQKSFIDTTLSSIKKWVWIYFWLLLFEGALRRWVLPSLAAPLLIIRDPVAVWIMILAYKKNVFPVNFYIVIIGLITVVSIYTAISLGHHNIFVALYGARIYLLHFPLIFVIGNIFTKKDVIKTGKVLLWISLPMTVLIIIQFYSTQNSWVNAGLGGDVEGAGFSGALGFFRPPGTFSFTTGVVVFYGLIACFIFYFWTTLHEVKKLLLFISTICLFVAIPFSISRSLFFEVIVSIIFFIAAITITRLSIIKFFVPGLIVAGALVILTNEDFSTTATEAFTTRFETASEAEGGAKGTLQDRYLGGMVTALENAAEQPFFGYGLGMGTNVGAQLLVGDRTIFLISEGEWGRVFGELGAILGLSVIFIRLSVCWQMLKESYRKLRQNDLLPWMLLSMGLLTIPQGQWAQPTALGFSVFIGGLIFASFNDEEDTLDDEELEIT